MRKAFGMILACALLGALLSGCQKKETPVQPALDFRTLVMDAAECRFSAEAEADYGDRVHRFSLDCVYLPKDGTAGLTVTAPDTIAGIAATVDGKTANVTFEDTRLELGTLAGGQVAPMQLPQLLGAAWTNGYIVSISEEKTGWLATYQTGYGEETLDILTHFTAQGTPRAAEIYADGSCVLSAAIDNFSLSESSTKRS